MPMLAPANDAAIAKPAIANLFDAPSLDSIDVDAIIQEYGAGGPSFGGFGLAEALHIVNDPVSYTNSVGALFDAILKAIVDKKRTLSTFLNFQVVFALASHMIVSICAISDIDTCDEWLSKVNDLMLSQTAALQSTDWAAVSSCDMRRALRLQLMAACAVMATTVRRRTQKSRQRTEDEGRRISIDIIDSAFIASAAFRKVPITDADRHAVAQEFACSVMHIVKRNAALCNVSKTFIDRLTKFLQTELDHYNLPVPMSFLSESVRALDQDGTNGAKAKAGAAAKLILQLSKSEQGAKLVGAFAAQINHIVVLGSLSIHAARRYCLEALRQLVDYGLISFDDTLRICFHVGESDKFDANSRRQGFSIAADMIMACRDNERKAQLDFLTRFANCIRSRQIWQSSKLVQEAWIIAAGRIAERETQTQLDMVEQVTTHWLNVNCVRAVTSMLAQNTSLGSAQIDTLCRCCLHQSQCRKAHAAQVVSDCCSVVQRALLDFSTSKCLQDHIHVIIALVDFLEKVPAEWLQIEAVLHSMYQSLKVAVGESNQPTSLALMKVQTTCLRLMTRCLFSVSDSTLSDECKHLINDMIEVDMSQRITTDTALDRAVSQRNKIRGGAMP